MTWTESSTKFREVVSKAGGPSKSSSGSITVTFDLGEIHVELGGYDIGGWSRHHEVGVFSSEKEAMEATDREITIAEEIVKQEEEWDELYKE